MAFTITDGGQYLQAVASGLNKTFAEGTQTKFDLLINDKWKIGEQQVCYQKVEALDLSESGKYLIAATVGKNTYCLPNGATTSAPTGIAIPSVNDTLWVGMEVSAEWEFVSDGNDKVKIKATDKDGTRYLNYDGGLKVGDTQYPWNITHIGGKIFNIDNGSGYCGLDGETWKTRSSSFFDSDGRTKNLHLFKRVN